MYRFVVLGLTLLCLITSAQSVPPLINYQGRLTTSTGAPQTSGLYKLQFRLWDKPTGTNGLIWSQQLTVTVQSNGVFNAILGAPGGSTISTDNPAVNNLTYAFSSTNNVFLGVTPVASNGIAINSPSEILPRQQLLSVPFAITALNASNSLNAVSASVASSVLPGSIVNASLGNGIVTLTNLAPRPVTPNASTGGVAASSDLSITIQTSGRPVMVLLTANPDSASPGGAAVLFTQQLNPATITLKRDNMNIAAYSFEGAGISGGNWHTIPASLVFLDTPQPGSHSYTISISGPNGQSMYHAQLVAFEL